jgi:N-acetylglutamate synthase-like GNAT family acetyltransferase
MKIRNAKASDLNSLLQLYDHLRGGLAWVKRPPMSATEGHRRALSQMLKEKNIHILVAEEGGKVVGTCTLYILPRVYWSGKPWAILDSIVVGETAQGQGNGSKLIKHAHAIAKKAGCSQVNLTSNTKRTRAHRFYENLGFEPTYVGFKLTF